MKKQQQQLYVHTGVVFWCPWPNVAFPADLAGKSNGGQRVTHKPDVVISHGIQSLHLGAWVAALQLIRCRAIAKFPLVQYKLYVSCERATTPAVSHTSVIFNIRTLYFRNLMEHAGISRHSALPASLPEAPAFPLKVQSSYAAMLVLS